MAIFSIEIFKKIFFSNYTVKIDRINFRLRDRINKKNKFLLKNIEYIFIFPKILSLITDKKVRDEIKRNYSDEIKSYNSFTYIKLR